MNWIAKLILIIVTAITAVVGILFFYKTIVSPPQQIAFSNQHIVSLQNDVDMMKGDINIETADSIMDTTLSAIWIFQKEGFIDTVRSDQVKQHVATSYIPYFVADYKRYFSGSDWSKRHNNQIRQKALMLLGLKKQKDGKPILNDSLKQQVDSANIILGQYDEAWDLCQHASFINLLESERTIDQANHYAESVPLCNCSTLVNQLKNIDKKLELSHFNKLINMVEELDMYPYYTPEYFQSTLVPNVNDALKEYKNLWNLQIYTCFRKQSKGVLL